MGTAESTLAFVVAFTAFAWTFLYLEACRTRRTLHALTAALTDLLRTMMTVVEENDNLRERADKPPFVGMN